MHEYIEPYELLSKVNWYPYDFVPDVMIIYYLDKGIFINTKMVNIVFVLKRVVLNIMLCVFHH